MLKFIYHYLFSQCQMLCFNTSHVKVYLRLHRKLGYDCICFNTSHVKVYQVRKEKMNVEMLSFNTSHVKVYHIINGSFPGITFLFQYISC